MRRSICLEMLRALSVTKSSQLKITWSILWQTSKAIDGYSKSSAESVTKNKHHHRFFKKFVYVLGRASLRNTRLGASKTLRTRLLSSQRISNKYILHDQNKFFCRMNTFMFEKDLCFVCNTNIFCIKIYFSMRCIFLHFHLCFSL